ncbi:MAG: response regulator [Nitrospirota bacterium]
MLRFIRKRLGRTILTVLAVSVALVMVSEIYLRVSRGTLDRIEMMTVFGKELAASTYAGIKHPMSVGDADAVKKQLLDIKEKMKGGEVFISDFNQVIIYATHEEKIKTRLSDSFRSQAALQTLNEILQTGVDPQKAFEEEVAGKRYLITMHPILNHPDCFHCHGSSRKVLGSMVIKMSADPVYREIIANRNRSIVITIFGIATIIALTYAMLTRLVSRPIENLAEKAKKFAEGDMSVSVEVRTEDEIGVLGNSFNYMIKSIKDQIEYANSIKDAICDPLFIVNNNMIITYMNEACARLTGYGKGEVEGKMSCRDLFKSDICETTCPVKYCFDKEEPVEGIRANIINREGIQIPIMTSASPLKDAHGNLIGAIEICKDITELLEVERLRYIKKTAEREEEQRVYLEGRSKNLLSILTQASEGNLNVRAEVMGKNDVMDEIAHHANLMLENLAKLYEKISSFSKELEIQVARRTMMLREKTLLLERANRELRELDRLKSAFLANMSHELRTPMNSIIGYTELLLDGVDGPVNEEQSKSLQKVVSNARHLLQLINDILDMSKIESGKIELDLKELDLKNIIESIVTTLEQSITKKGLDLNVILNETLPKIYADEDKTRQILINLLSNAIKFTNKGGITISAKPSERGVKPGEKPLFVEICVEDTGIGIKEEDIGKLFDKFSQLDISTIRQYEGTGLGLSIARGLVVLHKGIIWATSRHGEGSRFCFTLPVKREILEKPSEPILEPLMAEGLSEYFNKPVETFLREPQYAGKPIKCWEYVHCGQTSCPAYGSDEHRCWLILGTHCKGTKVAAYPEKVDFCKGCEIIERLILESEEFRELGIPGAEEIESYKKTVMVIDDNPEAIDIIAKYLGEDYHVVGLLSGEGAAEKAKEIKPIAITLDIMMPVKDGWQVLQELKNTPEIQDIPVIILSIVDDKKLGFSLGAAEYIVKPVEKWVLLRKLKNLEKIAKIQKILVVDNEPGTIKLIADVLGEVGYQVTTAYNSEDAIKSIKSSLPNLIVLNLTMPEVSGFDVIEYIKTEKKVKSIPLIVLTHKDLTDEEIDALNGRIQGILNKGILTKEDLLKELKSTINKCYEDKPPS